MISVDLVVRLKAAGLVWTPASGDRFHLPDRDLDDTVFVVSEMTIETADLPTGLGLRRDQLTPARDLVLWPEAQDGGGAGGDDEGRRAWFPRSFAHTPPPTLKDHPHEH